MSRAVAVLVLVSWAGVSLLFDELRWFRRRSLSRRLLPYAPTSVTTTGPGDSHPGSITALVTPLAQQLGNRVTGLLGATEETSSRLDRVHSNLSLSQFRLRQFGWCSAAFGAAGLVGVGLALPPLMTLFALFGAPLLAFLVVEQRLAVLAANRSDRLLLELPTVAEQLAMLIASGYSLGGALNRLAQRGRGACGADLTRICARIRQGLGDLEALREWDRRARVDAVTRLVNVLSLHRQAGDLGHLLSEEARAVRREVHRQLIDTIERRAQQVWIPVTVATLVPGVLFLAVPFIEAMRLFTTE
jgi:tight adherence protein C